jgi:hypothetical protein
VKKGKKLQQFSKFIKLDIYTVALRAAALLHDIDNHV